MSDNSHEIIPAENNPEKLPSKIRHTEDERRITHENTAEQSRLEHQEDSDENVLRHNETTEASGLQHEETDGANPDTDSKLKKLLDAVGNVVLDDRDSIGAQAVKHDVFQVPTAILGTIDEVNRMRNKGQRLLFENKDKNAEPVTSGNTASVNNSVAEAVNDESGDNAPTEEVLALPEHVLSLPSGNEIAETTENEIISAEDITPDFDGESGERTATFKPDAEKDYYKTLGVDKDADESDIKNAYRSLAKQYHPDVNNGDKIAEAKFKEINEAYSVLGDPQKRQAYDQKITAVNKPAKKPAAKPTVKPNNDAVTADGIVGGKPQGTAENKDAKTQSSGKNGKRKDRFMRRVLDKGFIFSQAATHLMPDAQQDEDSGTKGVRSMISESAKIIKVFATAEKKPKKMRHAEDEERLTHENTQNERRLEHEEIIVDESVLQHEQIDGEEILLLEDSESKETENDELIEQDEILQIGDGDISEDTGQALVVYEPENPVNSTADEIVSISDETESTINTDILNDDGIIDNIEPGISQPKILKDIKTENKIDHNINRYTAQAEKLEKKIKKAEKKIPKKKVKKSKLVHDEKTGKTKRQISFADEKVDKADAKWNQGQSKTLTANAGRYATGHASAFVHGKISEVENQTGNTGLKAAHTGEKLAVKGYTTVKGVRRYVKNAPYRQLQHLKEKEVLNKGKLTYQQLLKDKPELRKSKNAISRLIQKRRIKKEYAAAFRAAQNGGKAAGAFGAVGVAVGAGAAVLSGDGKGLAKMGAQLGLKVAFKKAGMALVKAAAPILLKIGLILLIIGAILLLFTMCASLIGTGTGYILDSISYSASEDDITEYSVYMTELEVDLKEQILDAASDLDGFHEFRLVINKPGGGTDIIFEGTLITAGLGYPYNTEPVYAPPDFDPAVLLPFLTDITHNPFELMAYLTAEYGDFSGYDIKAILEEIFNTAFELEIVESFEVKTATVECWYYDIDGYRIPPYTETMYYNWYYKEVVLTINSTISEVIQDRLDDDNQEQFALLMETLGLRQFVGSPFENNWLGNVSSIYGYRFHPITKTREMHNGIDIAMPEGTPILSGLPGTVTFAGDMGGYGNTVIIEYIDAETGKGVKILYAHLKDINVAVGDTPEAGEPIGTVGDTGTATGFHVHMEVSINEGGGAWRYINPLFFVEPYVTE